MKSVRGFKIVVSKHINLSAIKGERKLMSFIPPKLISLKHKRQTSFIPRCLLTFTREFIEESEISYIFFFL